MAVEVTMDPDLIERDEVCRTLRTSPRNLRRLVAAGKFPPPLRVGRRRLWPRRIIQAWIERPYTAKGGCA